MNGRKQPNCQPEAKFSVRAMFIVATKETAASAVKNRGADISLLYTSHPSGSGIRCVVRVQDGQIECRTATHLGNATRHQHPHIRYLADRRNMRRCCKRRSGLGWVRLGICQQGARDIHHQHPIIQKQYEEHPPRAPGSFSRPPLIY